MPVINKGTSFSNGEQLTADKINDLLDLATFTQDATDSQTTTVNSAGQIRVNPGGISPTELSAGGPRWSSTAGRLYVDGILDSNNYTTGGISVNGNLVGDRGYAFIDLHGDSTGTSEYVRLLNSNGNCSLENKKDGRSIKLVTNKSDGTNNPNALVVNGNGNVGIGDPSPDKPLTVVTTDAAPLKLQRTGGSDLNTTILFENDGGTDWYAGKAGANGFGIGTSADLSGTAKFRINNSGNAIVQNNLLVGGTDTSPYNNTAGSTGSGNSALAADGAIYSGRYQNVPIAINTYGWTGDSSIYRDLQHFYVNGLNRGKLQGNVNGQVRLLNQSDYRLKEDVIDIESSIEKTKQLNPVNFAWKESGNRVDGFIAHELQEVCPDAVSGTKDEVDDEGNPEYQGIDQSKIIPLLTKALQEAITKIETLEARLDLIETV